MIWKVLVKLYVHWNVLDVLFTKLIPKRLIVRLIKRDNSLKVSLFWCFKIVDVIIYLYTLLGFFQVLFLDTIVKRILHFLFTKSKLFVLLEFLLDWLLLTRHGIDHLLFFCSLELLNRLNYFLLNGIQWNSVEFWVLKADKVIWFNLHWNFVRF